MKKIFYIGKHQIKEKGRVFVIAEAGVNHNGKLDLALKLVDMASEIGADAIKFQTFKAAQVVTENGKMASYQEKNIGKKTSQLEMLKSLELQEEFYPKIIKRCKEKQIIFFSTPQGGKESLKFLEKQKVIIYKIDSGNLTNYILIDKIAKTKKPIILSTGMATLKEVEAAIKFIKSRNNNKIAVLHCTTNYPAKKNEIDLEAMVTMMEKLDVPVGYSDHSQDDQVAIMAATLGMAVYEFHITLDKRLIGPDHIASCNPEEAKKRINLIRATQTILGNSEKQIRPIEKQYLKIVRRSLVYTKNLAKDHIIEDDDIDGKRPGDGISPIYYKKFIGRKLIKDVFVDQQLESANFEK